MMRCLFTFLFLCSCTFGNLPANESLSEAHLSTLYRSLDQRSIAELFAFYHLYPSTFQGETALADAWELLNLHREEKEHFEGNLVLPPMNINAIISLVNKQPFETSILLDEEQLKVIEKISDHLANRKLKGFQTWEKEDIFKMPSEDIDLARALLLYQFEKEEDMKIKVRQYEASLDLIALQILAKLSKKSTPEEKIHAINKFIFYEKRFRFPPHSLWAKDIDLYTFLPSVLDNRLGVCLGVSILYLSIAQRLDLPLEIITPPGHIYIRYQTPEKTLNIETTARGISLPSKAYLGINTRKLQTRTIKEIIGLAFINQASVSWHREEYKTTVDLYEKALPYLANDPLLKMLLGYNYLFIGKLKEGTSLLKEIENVTFDYAVYKETTPEDFLNGLIDTKGIQTIFQSVDETRNSILDKQKQLKRTLKNHPKFRDGHLQLAITYLQLGRRQEAFETLLTYHRLDPNNPVVEYYLSVVCMERFHYKEAWDHLKTAQRIVAARDHDPECLKGLRHYLRTLYADPEDAVDLGGKKK